MATRTVNHLPLFNVSNHSQGTHCFSTAVTVNFLMDGYFSLPENCLPSGCLRLGFLNQYLIYAHWVIFEMYNVLNCLYQIYVFYLSQLKDTEKKTKSPVLFYILQFHWWWWEEVCGIAEVRFYTYTSFSSPVKSWVSSDGLIVLNCYSPLCPTRQNMAPQVHN